MVYDYIAPFGGQGQAVSVWWPTEGTLLTELCMLWSYSIVYDLVEDLFLFFNYADRLEYINDPLSHKKKEL